MLKRLCFIVFFVLMMWGNAWAEDLAQDTSQVEIASEVVADNEDAVQDADVDEYIEDMDNSWGCEKLTDGEIVAAKALLCSAEEILNEDKPVKYEDISFKKGLLWVSDIGYPSQDFYVRFAKDEKFRNLGALLGCHITVRDIPVAFEGKYPTVEDRLNKIEKKYKNCLYLDKKGVDYVYDDELKYGDPYYYGDRLYDIRQYNCYKEVALEMFDEFENIYTVEIKKNFLLYIDMYDRVWSDLNCKIIPFSCVMIAADMKALERKIFIENLLKEYMKKYFEYFDIDVSLVYDEKETEK